ncbi:unnamed protein product [Protopolystoma xenopodis]|uniref:Uncharacterized protein n=1 Tax=Protopolystoma xenopodis TaxID=117903 RepID=A0A448X6H4_9PLAT|nr:unnamed protein product [Protopolystoma xenopodis]
MAPIDPCSKGPKESHLSGIVQKKPRSFGQKSGATDDRFAQGQSLTSQQIEATSIDRNSFLIGACLGSGITLAAVGFMLTRAKVQTRTRHARILFPEQEDSSFLFNAKDPDQSELKERMLP